MANSSKRKIEESGGDLWCGGIDLKDCIADIAGSHALRKKGKERNSASVEIQSSPMRI